MALLGKLDNEKQPRLIVIHIFQEVTKVSYENPGKNILLLTVFADFGMIRALIIP